MRLINKFRVTQFLAIKSKNHISANSFRGNYSFLNLTLCTVRVHTGVETTQERKLFKGGNYSQKYCNLIMLTTLFYETAMMSMQRKLIQARLVSVRVDLVEIRFGHDLMFYSKAEFLQLSLQQLSA